MLESWSRTAKPSAPYNGEHVLVFSLEMTAEALTERMVSSRARVNTRNYNQAEKRMTLVEGDLPKLANGTTVVSKLPIIIDDTAGLSIGAIRARARRYFHRNKVRLIIVDYLQLIASEPGIKSNERRVEVDSISRGLKQLAKELRIPVLALAQLNREIEKDGKGRKPRMSDLRESGQIEQDADFIGFLYPDPADDKDIQSPDAEIRSIFLRIAKQRNGPKDFDIPLVLFPHIVKFESAAKPSRYADAA
jgi:replicative DNA helicase